MTDEQAIYDAMDLHEAYQRTIHTAMKHWNTMTPWQQGEVIKYRMAARDALDDALQFVPKDFITQLKPALGPRWRFRLASWRWRLGGWDRECDMLLALHDRWSGLNELI